MVDKERALEHYGAMAAEAREYARTHCSICRAELTEDEMTRLARDIDFIQHKDHLIRRELHN